VTHASPASRPAPRPAALTAALAVLCAGLVLSAVAFLPQAGQPQADDFMFPRELLLNGTAMAAALLCVLHARSLRGGVEDALLAAFGALGALSYVAAAGNSWLAARAFGLTAAGVAVFWCARSLAASGRRTALTRAAAVAAVALAATALVEAYGGVRLSLAGRAPGGALGHRNSAAHLMVLALPLLVLLAARTRRGWARWAVSGGVAMAGAVTVLSRSRGAWLAALALGLFALALFLVQRRSARLSVAPGARAALAGLALGAAAAVVLPNQLGWTSAAPEAETLRHLADYNEGSGRGRLVQYARTWAMVADHPALGVGPGNWMVQYPLYAAPEDPSFNPRDLVPTNRLPQGDWVGLAAERGVPALLLLLLSLAVIAARAARVLRAPAENGSGRAGEAFALLCTLAALAVLGVFDPILLQPLHAFFAFVVVGALAPEAPAWKELPLRVPGKAMLAGALLLALAAPLSVSTRQLWSAGLLRARQGPDGLAAAVRASPGDYRLQALLAEHWTRLGRCDRARTHIQAALSLFPTAPAPHAMDHRCAAAAPVAGMAEQP
jgi:putative inorganic carbon (HCO3(-)) transporter